MQIVLKKKIFNPIDRYNILDSQNNNVFRVEKKLFSLSNIHLLKDLTDNELCRIKKKVFSIFPSYKIIFSNGKIINVKKNTGSIKNKYVVFDQDSQYFIDGDVLENEFVIKRSEEPISEVKKTVINMFKGYSIAIKEKKNLVPSLAIILALDLVKFKKFSYLL